VEGQDGGLLLKVRAPLESNPSAPLTAYRVRLEPPAPGGDGPLSLPPGESIRVTGLCNGRAYR
jgi:hypothetical protein